MSASESNDRVYWVKSNLSDQSLFLGLNLIAIALWASGIPLASMATDGDANIGLFITSASVGLFLLISNFTTIDRIKSVADSVPTEIADMAISKQLKGNPWFVFAAMIVTVHIGIVVGHGIILLG